MNTLESNVNPNIRITIASTNPVINTTNSTLRETTNAEYAEPPTTSTTRTDTISTNTIEAFHGPTLVDNDPLFATSRDTLIDMESARARVRLTQSFHHCLTTSHDNTPPDAPLYRELSGLSRVVNKIKRGFRSYSNNRTKFQRFQRCNKSNKVVIHFPGNWNSLRYYYNHIYHDEDRHME